MADSTFSVTLFMESGSARQLPSNCACTMARSVLDVAETQHLIDGLDWQGAAKDIQTSGNWLEANGSKKVCACITSSPSTELPYNSKDILLSCYGLRDSERLMLKPW
ncbi:hypothetical protein Dimus_019724 [Dionaea muscipula]